MSTFTPSAYAEVPPFAVDTDGPARRLFRHFSAGQRGRNVYYLSDGTVTEVDPDSETVYWEDPGDGSTYVAQMWWGSTASAYTVTSAQATALTDAGYTVV